MKDYEGYLNKQAEILQEFDDFCEQFEQRAAENFKNPRKEDERFEILKEIVQPERDIENGDSTDS